MIQQQQQQQQQQEEEHPPGHPLNLVGSKRAKKIASLGRQIESSKTQIKQLADFQKRVISEATEAARASLVDMLGNWKRDIIDQCRDIMNHSHASEECDYYDQGGDYAPVIVSFILL
jgi:hypothetical protein